MVSARMNPTSETSPATIASPVAGDDDWTTCSANEDPMPALGGS